MFGRSRRGAAGQAKRAPGLTSSTTTSSTPSNSATLRHTTNASDAFEQPDICPPTALTTVGDDNEEAEAKARANLREYHPDNDEVGIVTPVFVIDDNDEDNSRDSFEEDGSLTLLPPWSPADRAGITASEESPEHLEVADDEDERDNNAAVTSLPRNVNVDLERKQVEACFDELLDRMQQSLERLKSAQSSNC